MRYTAKPGNPSKSSIRQIKLYSVAVKTAVSPGLTGMGYGAEPGKISSQAFPD